MSRALKILLLSCFILTSWPVSKGERLKAGSSGMVATKPAPCGSLDLSDLVYRVNTALGTDAPSPNASCSDAFGTIASWPPASSAAPAAPWPPPSYPPGAPFGPLRSLRGSVARFATHHKEPVDESAIEVGRNLMASKVRE